MKKLFLYFLLLAATPVLAARISAGWQSTDLNFGEPLVLTVKGDMNTEPALQWQQPSWLTSSGVQRNFYSINGRGSGTFSYLFTLNTPGTYTLPEVKINTGNEEITVSSCTVTVQPPQFMLLDGGKTGIAEGEKMIKAQVMLPAGALYTGMTVPVTLLLSLDSNLAASVNEMPYFGSSTAKTGNIVFINAVQETANGQKNNVYTFNTWLRPYTSGKLEAELFSPVNILLASRRETVLDIPYEFPAVQVLPLPPVPAGVLFTGATGDYDIYCRVTGENFSTGEALVLQVYIVPLSAAALPEALDTVTAPEFTWDNCRVYPPEIRKKNDGSIVIEYVFIPLRPGELQLPEEFAVFNTATGKYVTAGLDNKVTVAPGTTPVPPQVTPPSGSSTVLAPPSPADTSAFPFWLRETEWPTNNTLIPLLAAIIFLAGPAVVLIQKLVSVLWVQAGNAGERKKMQKALHSAAARAEAAAPEEFRQIMDENILPILRTSGNFAGGSSLEEIASGIASKDPALAGALKDYAASAYAPGGTDKNLAAEICRKLQKYTLIFLLAFFAAPTLLHGAATADKSLWEDAMQACTEGKWQDGSLIFRTLLTDCPRDPALWYNLGICAANSGDWGKAVWRFAGANQLDPDDRIIMDALNTAEKAAGVPLTGSLETPGALLRYCRDQLRPSLWLLVGAVCWSILWIVWGTSLRKHIPRSFLRGMSVLLLFFFLCALAAWYTQRHDTYATDRGIIITDAPLLSLPGGINAAAMAQCRSGENFKLLASGKNYLRVTTSSGSTGWIKEEYCGLLPDSVNTEE